MVWLWLALLSAISLAIADAVSKYGLKDTPTETQVVARFAFAALGMTPLALMQSWVVPPPEFWIYYAILLPIEIAAAWLYMRALRVSPMSLVLPMLAFTPLFLMPSAFAVLGEIPSGGGVAGVVLIVVGAYLLGLRVGEQSAQWWQPLAALGREPGVGYMVGTACLYAVTAPLTKKAMALVTPIEFATLYFWGLAALSVVVFQSRTGRRDMWHGNRVSWIVLAAAMTVMVASHFVALSLTQAVYMIAVKRTSLLFGILIGVACYGEGQGRRRMTAGALMVMGVLVITLSA